MAGPSAQNDGQQARPPPGKKRTGKSTDTTPPALWLGLGLLGAVLICLVTVYVVFDGSIPALTIILAVAMSSVLSVAGVRAMGQTDNDPVSGLGKLSQFVFALILSDRNPSRFIINITVGAIAEAAATQSANLISDLKSGSIVDADPGAQMWGHMIGSIFGGLIGTCFYKLYSSAYDIPGSLFQVPTAYMWVFAARLAYGGGLPAYVGIFALAFGISFALSTALKIAFRGLTWTQLLPSGVAFAIGMYNVPAFTLPRVLGGLTMWYIGSRFNIEPQIVQLLAASLVLGESVFSLIGLLVNFK